MKNSSNKKRTIVILYIINYAVSIALLIANLVTMFNFGNILLLTTVISYLALFTINTILIKKWYHFLGCSLPYTIVNVIELLIIYMSHNHISFNHLWKIHLPGDPIVQMLLFCFIDLCTIFFFMWTITTGVFKYKFNTDKKSSVRFASFTLLIVGLGLMAVFKSYITSVDFLFGQAEFSFYIFLAGSLISTLFIILPVRKKNQQE